MNYRVRPGDTAVGIARHFTGDASRWVDLRMAYPRRDWTKIYVGELLRLPDSWSSQDLGAVTAGDPLAAARRVTSWLPDEFFDRFVAMARLYGMEPLHAGAVVHYESGFRSTARHPVTDASGLIQWMPKNIPGRMPPAQWRAQSELVQLAAAEKWFRDAAHARGGPFRSGGEVYAIVFCPGRLSPRMTEETKAFGAEDGDAYTLNRRLDRNLDGKITIGDLTYHVNEILGSASFAPFAARIRAADGGRGLGGEDGGGPASGAGSKALAFAFGAVIAGGIAAVVAARS